MRLGIRKGCPAFCTQEVGAGAPQQRQSRRYGGSLLQGGGLVLKALFLRKGSFGVLFSGASR